MIKPTKSTFLNKPNVPNLDIDTWYAENLGGAKVDILKIDVEGGELQVLKSCKILLSRFKPILYIEISSNQLARFDTKIVDIEDILAPLGYLFYKNTGERNSKNDYFTISSLEHIADGGNFFDLLAIHGNSDRLVLTTMQT